MKTQIINLLSIPFIAVILINGCQKIETNLLSANDEILLGNLKASYENARIYDDSLKILNKNIQTLSFNNCDSLFHQYVSEFDSLHHMYSHKNAHDDHYHDGMGMHLMGTMMGIHHSGWSDGHHKSEHDMMDNMVSDHNSMFHSVSGQSLLGDMKESYENALLYNDSLKIIDKNKFPDYFAFCDSAFHYNTIMFDSLHNSYPHNNAHDDHYHDSMGMHMMGNMIGKFHEYWSDGHHKAEHDLMDNLESGHQASFH